MMLVSDLSLGARPHRPAQSPPGLRLDFIAQIYHPGGFGSGMTFTRAGTATYIDATGAMQVAAADQPRLNHDPVTLAPLGILIEGARTNLFLQSGAPVTRTVTVTAQPYALSFQGAGSITLSGAHAATLTGPGGAARAGLVFTPTAGSLTLTVAGDVQMVQLEAGNHATSYIPTAAAPVTRAADSLQVALGAWWPGAASGAIMAEFDCPPVAQAAAMAYFNSTSFQNSIGLSKTNAINNAAGTHLNGAMYDGIAALSVPLDLGLASGPHRAAMSWGGGTMQAVANGVAGPEVAQRSPAPTKLWLGQRDGTALHINGHLRRVLHYPRRLTAAQMQTLTA